MKRRLMHYIHGLIYVLNIVRYFLSFPIAFIIYGRKRYWLISEVDFDARDNGYHLFKFLNDQHKEINSIYLIRKTNPMYKNVSSIGKTLEPGSFKHWLVYIASKYKLFTYVHGCCPNYYIQLLMRHIHSNGKSIALKHGIFKNLHPNYFNKNAHLDMICCGAEPEYKFIDANFGYKQGVAKYTGLARFDNLHNLELKDEIFIMPTWRRWLNKVDTLEAFKQTDYFKRWFEVLSDSKVSELITKHNVTIVYYVHPALNKFLEAFNGLSTNIVFLNSKNGNDIQSHLKSAKLLITDFSSVFFDFAYMNKPSIYYQFDEDKYYELHYIKAYFDYRVDGFGPVFIDKDSVVNEIEKLLNSNYKLDKQYIDNIRSFFPLNDTNNCERIYNSVINL